MKKHMTQETTNVRGLALDTILAIMEKDQYCDQALHATLDSHPQLDARDRAFLNRLVSGTVERCVEMDYVLNRYSKTPVARMKPVIRNLLRMSVYQILYMDQVPDSAACNEAVKLAVARHLMPLKDFVNGVLRNIARFQDDIVYPKRKDDPVRHLSVWYSMPEWIVKDFLDRYGEERTERILGSFYDQDHETTVRCNLTCQSREEIVASLRRQNVTVQEGTMFPYALHISSYGRLTDLEAFQKGWIQVQDISSMLVAEIAAPNWGDHCIDVCAAPGGKSLHLADKLRGSGFVEARDVSEYKVELMQENIDRTGYINIKAEMKDAIVYDPVSFQKADIVLADVPCSGLGVIGKKQDIKYKMTEAKQMEIVRLQRKILHVVQNYVKPGGVLIYSTCTIGADENQLNVKLFL